MTIILGNIFALFSKIFMIISFHQKTKKSIMGFQIFDGIFNLLSLFVLSGYSGVTTVIVSLTRNIVTYINESKKITNKKYLLTEMILLVIANNVLGVFYNNRGYWGLLPLIASTIYTISLFLSNDAIFIKQILLLNLILWTLYYFVISNFVGIIMSMFGMFNIMISLYKNKKSHVPGENNIVKK